MYEVMYVMLLIHQLLYSALTSRTKDPRKREGEGRKGEGKGRKGEEEGTALPLPILVVSDTRRCTMNGKVQQDTMLSYITSYKMNILPDFQRQYISREHIERMLLKILDSFLSGVILSCHRILIFTYI